MSAQTVLLINAPAKLIAHQQFPTSVRSTDLRFSALVKSTSAHKQLAIRAFPHLRKNRISLTCTRHVNLSIEVAQGDESQIVCSIIVLGLPFRGQVACPQ